MFEFIFSKLILYLETSAKTLLNRKTQTAKSIIQHLFIIFPSFQQVCATKHVSAQIL